MSTFQSKLVNGTINTQNLNAATTATPGSAVVARTTGFATLTIQTQGTYTGALTVQATLGSVDSGWITLGSTSIVNVNTGAQSSTIPSAAQGIYQVDITGFSAVRVTGLAAVTGSVSVTMVLDESSALVGIDTPIVLGPGTASIGAVSTPAGSAYSLATAATTNAAIVKSTAGNLFEISVSNPTATPAYVKLYNKATAPTVGTDVPVMTIVAPATTATQLGTINLTFSQIGKRFLTGIGIAVTAGPLATDTAASVAGVQVHATYI